MRTPKTPTKQGRDGCAARRRDALLVKLFVENMTEAKLLVFHESCNGLRVDTYCSNVEGSTKVYESIQPAFIYRYYKLQETV